jgi:hypothetical protein
MPEADRQSWGACGGRRCAAGGVPGSHTCGVRFDYRLKGTGWAEAVVAHQGSSVTVTASYLSDALGNLLAALLDVLNGEGESRVSWDEEPGEYRWIITGHSDYLGIEILEFSELWGDKSDSEGKQAFQVFVPLTEAVAAFIAGADAVLLEHGEAGYLEQWHEHPFPSALLGALKERATAL